MLAGVRAVIAAAWLVIALGCGAAPIAHNADAPSRLEIRSADADVWAFELDVQAEIHGAFAASSCVVDVGTRRWPAMIRGAVVSARVELVAGRNDVRARCTSERGVTLASAIVHYDVRLRSDQPSFEQLASNNAATTLPREWLDTAVGYGVLPPVFGPAGLRDVTASLDALADLGVNMLWLAPIFAAPAHDYGYAVVDYFRVRPEYGNDADFAALIEQAHQRGLRVILDLPANHTSNEHPYFVQAKRLGRRSHYYELYDRDAAGEPTHYFDWDNLPNLDYEDAEVERFMFEVGRHWTAQLGADGYRVDAAWGIRQRSPSYWPRFSAALHAVRSDVFLLAEASARDDYYLRNGFDAAYDWTDELGHHAWRDVFEAPEEIAQRLDAAVRQSMRRGGGSRTWRFLNNNDTGKRFITRHGEDLTRVATVALLTLPGIPCLFSFDERGAAFQPYSELTPVDTTRGTPLRDFHQRWIWLRRTHPALATGSFEPLPLLAATPNVYAFIRAAPGSRILIALNFSGGPAQVSLNVATGREARDWMTGESAEIKRGQLQVPLKAWGARAFELE